VKAAAFAKTIHISDTCAKLLKSAPDTSFKIASRGELEMKGKNSIATSNLEQLRGFEVDTNILKTLPGLSYVPD
jgi:hypothetical protein